MLPIMAETSQLIIVSDIMRATLRGLVKMEGHRFEVTAKGGRRDRRTIQWRPLIQFALFAVATILGIVSAFIFDQDRLIEGGGALCLFWSWYNLAVLVICCLVSIEQPRYRKDERHVVQERAVINIGDHVYRGEVIDISAGGLLVRGNITEPIGTPVTISIGELRVAAVVIRKGPNQIALKVEGETARSAMIRHIYSGRGDRRSLEIRGSQVAMKVVQRVFR
jgi:cellulose synthase (UDP-forming)